MGSSQPAIRVVIIDLRAKPEDFWALTKAEGFECMYYDTYNTFLQNQSLKELSYIIIREKEQRHESIEQIELNEKINQSSVIAKSYRNMQELQNEFNAASFKNEVLLREKLITYIRKYSLQRLVIYLLVQNVLDFKLPEYEEPYITLIADKVEIIKEHLAQKPKGAEPTIFKFRRLVKDLYRRTVVKILNTDKDEDNIKINKKKWGSQLGQKITMNFSNFNEEEFQEGLISNYYDYIVVSNSRALSFIQDMKKIHKFESELVYHGKIEDYGKEQYGEQTELKLHEVKSALWMYSESIEKIADAIKKCTDIKGEETQLVARNVVIYTRLDYGQQNEEFIKEELLRQLANPKELKKTKSKDITEKGWSKKMTIKVVSTLSKLKDEFKKTPFSYLITFDCSINQIEEVKAYLRHVKYDKRVYMYNADEKESITSQISKDLQDDAIIKKYLEDRVKKVVQKAGFKIKFEIGPIDEITTYKLGPRQNTFFSNEMGLLVNKLESREAFLNEYMSKNREKLIAGFCLVLRAADYLKDWKEFLEVDTSTDPMSYFGKVKIVILDDKKAIKQHWQDLKCDIKTEKIAFVHYNLSRVRGFLEIMPTPRINLTIFVKKALPNFYKAYQKIIEHKYKRIELTSSIVSKSSLLREVFEDQNFRLSKHHRLSFLKLSNTNKNIEESIDILHEQFLVKYGMMWKTGYEVIRKEKRQRRQCLQTLKENIKFCLYKCKAYFLLNVSQEQFQYFYLEKLDQCKTFIDLHITMIYLFSLPHGLSNLIQLIFSDPLSTCLTPKMFVSFVVALLVCFCSFQDEVMKKKRFLIYMDDGNREQFLAIMNGLKIGDVLFNTCFVFAGQDQESTDNENNNCLFLEFQDIPMLSDTNIKNYLHMEPFSFYKESTEYLIAPYTQFSVKNIQNNQNGKVHVTLGAVSNSKQGFVAKVFEANNIKQQTLFQIVADEVSLLKSSFSENQTQRIKKIGSLYKKAELIGLYEQKVELVKSIKEGLQYKWFIQAMREKKVLRALSHLKKKEASQKNTTELQATYFKKMLGVEKSMLYYTLCEYDISMKELDKVVRYLVEQNVEESENWLIKKVKAYKQSINDLNTKRHKYLNRLEKTKKWKIQAVKLESPNQKLGVSMSSNKMKWTVGYNPDLEEFYIEDSRDKFYYYNDLPAFGELATAFTTNSAYQTLDQRNAHQKEAASERNIEHKANKPPAYVNQLQSHVRPIILQRESKGKGQGKQNLPDLKSNKQVSSEWLFKTEKEGLQALPNNELPVKSRVVEEKEPECRLEGMSSAELLPSSETKLLLSESQALMGVTKQIGWQAFYFQGKFILSQKGKHFKAKVPNKHNL